MQGGAALVPAERYDCGNLGPPARAASASTAHVVIANSELTRRDLIERCALDADRVHNIYLGCNEEWRPARPAERAAAQCLARPTAGPAAGRVRRRVRPRRAQRIRYTLDGVAAVVRRPDWDADLAAAGGGTRAAWWQDRIAHDGLASRVRWLGFTDRIFDLLAAADLLISPVRYEPYGLNVQEAVCRGIPALVSTARGRRSNIRRSWPT